MFNIVDKDGQDVPFILNHSQARLDAELTGRDIIPKARQLGISQYFLARYLADCLMIRNTRAVVIAHDRESTEKQLGRVHYMLENIRGPKAVISNSSKGEIVFPKTNSTFFIGTAGSRRFGRGDTITRLHCSEAAFWEDPKSLTAGLFQAVPRNAGEIAIESTGYGTGNWYHRQCMNAYEGKGRFRLHFFNWLSAPEYRVPLTQEERDSILRNPNKDWEEDKLLELGITPEQLMFRREKLEELDYDLHLFKQEYPISLDECFQSSGHSYFTVIPYVQINSWQRADFDRNLYYLPDAYKHPTSRYAIGVDVSAGVRRDRSVIQVIDIFKWEQVAEWVSDTTSPDILAKKIIELGKHYNDAFVTVETNNHGAVTLLKLIEGFPKEGIKGYPLHLLYSQKGADTLLQYGFKTSQRTKPIVLGQLRKEFLDGFKVNSPLAKDELSTFIENDNNKLEAQQGCFDDRVISLAIAIEGARVCPYIYERADMEERKAQAAKGLFDLDTVIAELRAKHKQQGGAYPIPYQDAGSIDGYSVH
jgi:hypothetical protein